MSDQELLPPIHPGEILQEEFLESLEISQYRLAKDFGGIFVIMDRRNTDAE